VGVLGAARFVLGRALERGRARATGTARQALEDFLAAAEVLEPTDAELSVAADLERLAQHRGVSLDGGESQLAAMVAARQMSFLDTGDKRAIAAFAAIDHCVCQALRGHIRCLEQLFIPLLDAGDFAEIVASVCAEPDVDKAMTACFACNSGGASNPEAVRAGLESYIRDVVRRAPAMLAAV
jgi:hypothetical protein